MTEPIPDTAVATRARAGVTVGFFTLMGFSVGYELLTRGALESSALMFVGLPTALAVLTVSLVRPRTALGISLMVTTLALLASAVLFREGALCILFAAPLFYGAAIGVAVLADYLRGRNGGPRAFATALLPILVLSTEGAFLSLPRDARVTTVARVAASPADVRAALARAPDTSLPLPATLRMGFPVPEGAEGSGLNPGDLRVIHFSGGEGRPPGDMTLRVARATPQLVRFVVTEDTTHLRHWVRWTASEVALRPVEGGTEVAWTVEYTRILDPAWYFDPMQRRVVADAAGWLIAAHTP